MLTNSTLSGNSASGSGGGIANGLGSVTLTNTILAANTAAPPSPDCSGTLNSGGYNLVGIGDGCGLTNGASGDQVGTSGSPLDALLGQLQDNGGPTLTMSPLLGSPAIEAVPLSNCVVTTDQRGDPRPAPGNTTCDIGAVEVQTTTGGVSVNLSLTAGWNLIALPVSPTCPCRRRVCSPVWWPAAAAAWPNWPPGRARSWTTDLDTAGSLLGTNFALAQGQGYFLYTDQPATLTVSGITPTVAPTLTLIGGLEPDWRAHGRAAVRRPVPC